MRSRVRTAVVATGLLLFVWNAGAVTVTSTVSDTVGGGAILNQGGVVTLERCRFDSNSVDTFFGDGGAVLSVGGPAPAVPAILTVRDSTFTMNNAFGGGAQGGAVANE